MTHRHSVQERLRFQNAWSNSHRLIVKILRLLTPRFRELFVQCVQEFSMVNVHSSNAPPVAWPSKSGQAGFVRRNFLNPANATRIARFLLQLARHDSASEKDFESSQDDNAR